jgi:undecaprenyl diphosphate synthase
MNANVGKVPLCVGIIMDGNRRWAKAKGMLTLEGHREGSRRLKDVVTWMKEAGVKHSIFYTFSTENWNRSPEEVSYLFNLIREFAEREVAHFHSEDFRLHFVGDLSRFPKDLQEALRKAEEKTAKNEGHHIYLALNYGGRQEILSAVRALLAEGADPKDITEEYFAKHLQTGDMPDPDLIIRTSGEMRLSGFLPWQAVYSELFFTETLWPDFTKEEFEKILEEFSARERRHGK